MKQPTNPWQTATIIGSVWGAFEVVAGSILHNIAVPMVAGTLLSAIGVMIMVTGARVLGGKGIFWRSALVCAALKTVSPSPVILTPMLGITLEGLLMEVGVLALGQNIAGYMLGGGLAVLSILGFKFVRLIMIYGTDIVEAYKSVFNFAFTNSWLNEHGFLIPIILFVVVYLLIGAFAAVSGFRGGNSIKERFNQRNLHFIPFSNNYKPAMEPGKYKGGIVFLVFHFVWLVAFIGLKGFLPHFIWLSGGIVYLFLCLFRYGRVRQMLSRPIFWIVITGVSITSSFFINIPSGAETFFKIDILYHGLTILVRASVVLISFTCIGIELMSKGVSRHFTKSYFKSLSKSYIQAQGNLPQLLSILKKDSFSIRNPSTVIEGMFNQFTTSATNQKFNQKIYIITGDKHAGKTTFLKEMVAYLENHKISFTGFLSEGLWENDKRSSFNLVTLPDYNTIPLCDRISRDWKEFGSFYFNAKAIELGINIMENAGEESIVFIDEVGLFELEGNIWANSFEKLLQKKKNHIVISVRKSFLNDVIAKWHLSNVTILDATSDCPEDKTKDLISSTL